MASFIDYDSYTPGELYRGTYGSMNPQQILDYNQEKKRVFKGSSSGDTGELFQRFLVLQSNPEALTKAAMQLPNTPFGNLAGFSGS